MSRLFKNVQRPGIDAAPPRFPRSLFIFWNDIVDELNKIIDAINGLADNIGEIYPPSGAAQGVKKIYATTLKETLQPGSLLPIGEKFVPGSTEFYWDRRRLIPETVETIAAGFSDYREIINVDGTYTCVQLKAGLKKGSQLIVWYSPKS